MFGEYSDVLLIDGLDPFDDTLQLLVIKQVLN